MSLPTHQNLSTTEEISVELFISPLPLAYLALLLTIDSEGPMVVYLGDVNNMHIRYGWPGLEQKDF